MSSKDNQTPANCACNRDKNFCNHEGLGYICQNVLYKYSTNTKPKQRNAVIVVPSINYQQHTFVDGKSLTWTLYLSN